MGSNLLPHHLTSLERAGVVPVALHLASLERAGVVRRQRSEGDRRRTYVQLVPSALDGLIASPATRAPRVTFVCSRNSARSQLAAALWARASDVPAASAGTHPADRVHPGAVAAARRRGLSLRGARTSSVAHALRPDDLVVAVCDQAHEELGTVARVRWAVPDPVRVGAAGAFDRVLDDLDDRVGRLARVVSRP